MVTVRLQTNRCSTSWPPGHTTVDALGGLGPGDAAPLRWLGATRTPEEGIGADRRDDALRPGDQYAAPGRPKRRRRSELVTTLTLEKAMAAPASTGLSRPAAASGIAAAL
jgi:hypothetical protein